MPKSNLRTEYHRANLLEQEAGGDPIELFTRWFDEAVGAGGREPNAMSLATVDESGCPSVRIVLCKEFDRKGFVFYTNLDSRKGRELRINPNASLLFFWPDLERQVRISGRVERVSDAEADDYFSQRPLAARIGAWASPQSEVIATRAVLEQRFAQMEQRFSKSKEPPRPAHWGGLRLKPAAMEFWQGRQSRLHDRLLFSWHAEQWERVRLAP